MVPLMDDPMPRSEKDRDTERDFWGSRSQAIAPTLYLTYVLFHCSSSIAEKACGDRMTNAM